MIFGCFRSYEFKENCFLNSNVQQVGFFKKNPMKRSAAVYLLCVCLAF